LKEGGVLRGHKKPVFAVIHIRDQFVATGSKDHLIHIWDLTTNLRVATLEGHTSGIFGLCTLSDGNFIASCSQDKTARLWDVSTIKPNPECVSIFNNVHQKVVTSCCKCFQTDKKQKKLVERLVTASADGTIAVWNIQTGNVERHYKEHSSNYWCRRVCFLTDGRLDNNPLFASCSYEGSVKVWNANHENSILTFVEEGRRTTVRTVRRLTKDLLAAGYADETVKVWNFRTGEKYKEFKSHTNGLWSLCKLHQGKFASGSSDNTVRFWELSTGEEIYCLKPKQQWIESIEFVEESGTILTAGDDTTVRIWHLKEVDQKWLMESMMAFEESLQEFNWTIVDEILQFFLFRDRKHTLKALRGKTRVIRARTDLVQLKS